MSVAGVEEENTAKSVGFFAILHDKLLHIDR